MKINRLKYTVLIVVCTVFACITITGCKGNKGNDVPNPDTQVTGTESKNDNPSEKNEPVITEAPSVTPTAFVPTPTLTPDEDADEPDEDPEDDLEPDSSDTDDGNEDEPDDVLPDDGYESLEQDRAGAWADTFLIWVPEFTEGTFTGAHAADTFDYAEFTDVSREAAAAYIALIEEKGFILNAEIHDKTDTIDYEASNSENWSVILHYDNGSFTIGSGFFEDEPANEKLNTFWASSMLSYLPVFAEGTFSAGENEGSSSSYAIFDGASSGYILEYIDLLENAGFVYEVDEGNEDGFIWYNAMNEDELVCDLNFYDGAVKISCDKE